jgi:hypothetical protein
VLTARTEITDRKRLKSSVTKPRTAGTHRFLARHRVSVFGTHNDASHTKDRARWDGEKLYRRANRYSSPLSTAQ